MTLLILRPGELSLVPFVPSATAPYLLDSILVAPHCTDQLQYVATAIDHATRFPCLPVLIGTSPAGLLPARLDGLANGLHLATLPLSMRARMDAGEIRTAVRARGAPTKGHFINWFGRRFDRSIEPPLGRMLGGGPVTRADVRELARYGRLGALQIRGLLLLCQLHGDSWGNNTSLDRLAERLGTTRKSAWDWGRRLLGMPWLAIKAITSWETILESAVRRAVHPTVSGLRV